MTSKKDNAMGNDNANGGSRQGLAPSEKHLEDYLWETPGALGWFDVPPHGAAPMVEFRWRQLRLPSGIVDLVGSCFYNSLFIAEVKKGPIDAAAFAQLMRYMHDFKQIMFNTFDRYQALYRPEWDRVARHPLIHGNWEDILLQGALIGHGVKDEALLIACEACNVDVYFYTLSDGEYLFEKECSGVRWGTKTYPATISAAQNGIQDELIGYIGNMLEFEREISITPQRPSFDAIAAATNYIDGLEAGDKDQ